MKLEKDLYAYLGGIPMKTIVILMSSMARRSFLSIRGIPAT